jgi:dipeptidyl aminopeptidase/acylaminoacyl peptidase
MRTLDLAAALLAVLAVGAPARAETPARYSLELARKLVGLGSPRVSPDGKHVAFVVTRPNFEQNRNESELWLADAAAGGAHALTFERHSVGSPQWSPDGASIAFMAPDDKDQAQV